MRGKRGRSTRPAGARAIGATQPTRLAVVASAGGHWEQLMLLRDAFADADVTYVTTLRGLGERAGIEGIAVVPDCNRHRPIRAAWSAMQIGLLLWRVRPDVIVTTGALPGVIALAIGRRLGARTVWVDSIANAEEMSMAGLQARRHADLWLSQWPHVAAAAGADYAGSVL